MNIRIAKDSPNTAKAFISNADLKCLDISVNGIVAKDRENISKLYRLMTAVRGMEPFHDYFITDVIVRPEGIFCLLEREENSCEMDPFFRDIREKRIKDYRYEQDTPYDVPERAGRQRNGSDVNENGPSEEGWAYSDPIPVCGRITVSTEDMSAMLACACILKEATETSCLAKQDGEYHLNVQLKEETVKNSDRYIAMWLNLMEFGQPDVFLSGEGNQMLIGENAVERLVSMC